MKGLLIRFTRRFNRMHSRSGTLWEERFKSVMARGDGGKLAKIPPFSSPPSGLTWAGVAGDIQG